MSHVPPDKRCLGTTKKGRPCGAARAHGTEFCVAHGNAKKLAPVIDITPQAVAAAHADGQLSREEYVQRLEDIMMGRVGVTKIAGDQVVEVSPSHSDMVKAASLLKNVRPELGGDHGSDEERALEAIAEAVRSRLGI